MKMNYGHIEGDKYIKRVTFAKAVLWKNRQLSLTVGVMKIILQTPKVIWIVFEDILKNERWTAPVTEVVASSEIKTEGQEEQYYFPISIFTKTKIVEEPKTEEEKFIQAQVPLL